MVAEKELFLEDVLRQDTHIQYGERILLLRLFGIGILGRGEQPSAWCLVNAEALIFGL